MAIAHVQTSSETTVSGASSGTIALDPTAGNSIFVGVMQISANVRTYTADDTINTYNTDVSQAAAAGNVAALIAAHNVAENSVTITVTGSGNYTARLRAIEVDFDGVGVLEDSSSIDEAATSSHVSAAAGKVDTAGEALLVTVNCTQTANLGTDTAGSGFTEIEGGANSVFMQYGVFASPQTDNQGAFTGTTSVATAGVIGAYKVTAAAGGDELLQSRLCISMP